MSQSLSSVFAVVQVPAEPSRHRVAVWRVLDEYAERVYAVNQSAASG